MLELGHPSTGIDRRDPPMAGVSHGASGVIGCWFLDPHAHVPAEDGGVVPLGADPSASGGRVALGRRVRPVDLAWTADRVPGGLQARVGRARDFDATNARWRRRPWRTHHGVPFECLVRRLQRMEAFDRVVLAVSEIAASLAPSSGVTSLHDGMLAALAPFLDGLDAEALATIRGRSAPPWGAYRGMDRTVDPGAPLAAAIAARPSMAWLLGRAWLDDPAASAADGVDAAVAAAATAATGLPRSGLRTVTAIHEATSGMPAGDFAVLQVALAAAAPGTRVTREAGDVVRIGDIGGGYLSHPGRTVPSGRVPVELCRLAADMHPNWRPVTEHEGVDFAASAHVVAYAGRAASARADVAALVGSGGKWADYAARVSTLPRGSKGSTVASRLGDVSDALARQVVEPAMTVCGHPSHPDDGPRVRRAAAALLWSGRAMPRIAEVSALWHRTSGETLASLMALPRHGWRAGGISWSTHLPAHSADGLCLVPLTTPRQLVDEGRRGMDADGLEGLGHCVAGYARDCVDGASRVASLRGALPDGGWRRLSTVEFGFERGHVVLRQHAGQGNTEPGQRERDFVLAYLASVNLRGNFATRRNPAPVHDAHGAAAGYDPTIPGNVEAAIALWAAFLPRPLRGMSTEDWYGLAASVPAGPKGCDALAGHWRRTGYAPADGVGHGIRPRPRSRWLAWMSRSARSDAIAHSWIAR